MIALWWFVLGCGEPAAPAAPAITLAPAAHDHALGAMDAAERAREALAADDLGPLPAAAADLSRHLAGIDAGPLAPTVAAGAAAAADLGAATDLGAAREAFSRVSEALFNLAAADPRLQLGWSAFRCPMADGFPKWFQRGDTMANPYMGQQMLTCGTVDGWGEASLPAGDDTVAYHTCPMHPSVHSSDPDAPCPICGMDLVPVTEGSLRSGAVRVDAIRRQHLGIRTAPVSRGHLDPVVRATGVVMPATEGLTEVVARVGGYVEDLGVAEGDTVRRGETVFSLYGPELLATQHDLLRAHAAGRDPRDVRRRLELWGVAPAVIDGVLAAGAPRERLPFAAPTSGVVLQLDVVRGAAVSPGQRLMQIADLSAVWVEAKVFEDVVDRVVSGPSATVHLGEQGLTRAATVDRVLPVLDDSSRSARVRLRVDNDDGALRVGSYVDVDLVTPTAEALLLPREAVIYAGRRRVVFVDRGEDVLLPVDVTLGLAGDTHVEVTAGLTDGDAVVVSGNFLVASESRLQAATGFWAEP